MSNTENPHNVIDMDEAKLTEIGISDDERTGDHVRATTSDALVLAGYRPDLRYILHVASGSTRRAAILSMLGRPIGWTSVEHWLSGRRPMPDWAIARVQERLAGLEAALLARRGKDRGTVGKLTLEAYRANKRLLSGKVPGSADGTPQT